MEQPKPIKRSIELMQLSREHHEGLLLKWKITEGINKHVSVERLSDYLLFFYSSNLEDHFNIEEQFLFPLLPAHNELRIRAQKQHDELRAIVSRIKLKEAIDDLVQFVNLLEEHIRFEERTLFNYIEQNTLPEVLAEAPGKIEQNIVLSKAKWDDEFWIKKN